MKSNKSISILSLFCLILTICLTKSDKSVEEEVYGVKYATDCEGFHPFVIYLVYV